MLKHFRFKNFDINLNRLTDFDGFLATFLLILLSEAPKYSILMPNDLPEDKVDLKDPMWQPARYVDSNNSQN